MPEPAAVPSAQTTLAGQSHHLTELLAAARTRDEVLSAALGPAIAALDALSGTVLLLDEGQQLRVVACQGQPDRTVWQDGPLDPGLPSGDAILRQQALYFEHSGEMLGAYPHLEEKTGGVVAVSSAVLPLLLDGQALGVLILDFREPHEFTEDERRFLPTLARQASLALDRAAVLQQREAEAATLRASEARFRTLVEVSPVGMAVGSPDGRLTLVNDAYLHLLGYTRAEFEAGEIDWQALTPEQYLDLDRRAFGAAFSQGVSTTYEKEMRTKAGERLPLELTLVRYDAQQVVGYLKDLRVQKAQEQRLRAEGQRLTRQVAQGAAALHTEQAAMQTFVQFTEAAGQLTDLDELARLALDTLRALIPGANVVLTELTPTRWALRHWTDNLDPELLAMARQHGFPLDTPVFAELLRTGEPSFTDGWDEVKQEVAHTGQFQAVAHYPILRAGQVVAAIGLAVTDQQTWTELQQAIIRSVGRSFTLLYDRISVVEQLQRQKDEAEQRNQVLEAFAALTAELTAQPDPYELVRRAQEIVLSLPPEGHALYWEPREGRWRVRAQTGDVGHLALQAAVEAGLEMGHTPTLDQPWQTGEPEYHDRYPAGRDLPAELTRQAQSMATLPIFRGEALQGVMNFTLTEPHVWRAVDQVVLETVQQSLSLALDRLHQQQVIEQQRDEAESRVRALEAFALMSRDLAGETHRYALIHRAQEIMLSLLTPGYALYWERAADHWELKSQVGDIGNVELQRLVDEQGLPLDTPALHSTWLTGVPNYQDTYTQGADTPAEMIRHVHAATAFRVQVHGEPVGMLAIGLFEQRTWTPMDRAVLETAIYSLGLVLERAESVEALEQVNHHLQAANEELEAFTYSASHDLRTPVRHVMGFAELAEASLKKAQYEKVAQHLGIVKQGAVRMNALIDGMLVLSRSGRQELSVQLVNLNLLATQARRDAAAEFDPHPVRWQIADLPTVQGDPQLLQQVVTNLLSNAVKYSAKREVSEVRVWGEERSSEWRIYVQDNGVGFDSAYAGKLFGIFQRLHTEREFQGTGVGLATVKRIILKHGGRVFAESPDTSGATFSFTLPKVVS